MGRPRILSHEDEILVLALIAEAKKLEKQLKGLRYPAIGEKFGVSQDVIKRLVKEARGVTDGNEKLTQANQVACETQRTDQRTGGCL